MKIGELAAATGLASSAIRFYEQSGLLPAAPWGENGYRNYSNKAIERLRVIQVAQSLGFSLDALRAVFANAEGFSKDELLRNLDARLVEIDALMLAMRAQRKELLGIRETLSSNWAAGNCVEAATLANGVVKGVSKKALKGMPKEVSRQARRQPRAL